MDKFIVSARKYRPQNFSTVVGQSHITTTLKNAINNNQLAHAFLFTGPRGVGKTTCARILAKTINCENRTADGEACNVCNSCKSFDNGSSLNIHELDAASNNSVDDIRSLVEQVRFAPQAGDYKVYIVDEVHMLSTSAFNAFLKTLEEPPSYAIFILATTEKHKILPTILSRCQIFDFKRITNNDTVEHLEEICQKETIAAERTALHLIAQKSEGCMRDSLSILDKIVSFTSGQLTYSNTLEHLNILDEDYYFKFLQFFQTQQLSDALLLFDEINAKGFEGDTLLEGFSSFLRNILISKEPRAAVLLQVAEDFKTKYVQAATETNPAWIIAALNIVNQAALEFKQAKNKRLHIEFALIKLAHLNQAIELINDLEGNVLKKKVTEQTKSVAFRSIRAFTPLKSAVPASTKTQTTAPIAKTSSEAPAQLIIAQAETKNQVAPTQPAQPTTTLAEAPKVTLKALNKIREQVREQSVVVAQKLPLSRELLDEVWRQIIEGLAAKDNHVAVSNFKSATLNILDDENFEILTFTTIQKIFIDQEQPNLVELLQQKFNNKNIHFKIILNEIPNNDDEPSTPKVSSREMYEKMIELNPQIKQLRDRLKLQLDY